MPPGRRYGRRPSRPTEVHRPRHLWHPARRRRGGRRARRRRPDRDASDRGGAARASRREGDVHAWRRPMRPPGTGMPPAAQRDPGSSWGRAARPRRTAAACRAGVRRAAAGDPKDRRGRKSRGRAGGLDGHAPGPASKPPTDQLSRGDVPERTRSARWRRPGRSRARGGSTVRSGVHSRPHAPYWRAPGVTELGTPRC